MKNILYTILSLFLLITACEEKADYEIKSGPFATFYPTTSAILNEGESDTLDISVELSGNIPADRIAYIKVPADASIITDPAYDPFSREIPLTISSETRIGTFKLWYRDNNTAQETDMYALEIVGGEDPINGVANEFFYLRVIDNDFFFEDFNATCSNTGGLPVGWTTYSVSSDYTWICSGENRGASGEFGDYALEMNNYQSPDGAPADDWLISPKIDLSTGNRVLSFSSMIRYTGTQIRFYYTENYEAGESPEEYEWTEITAASEAFDEDTGSFDYVESGEISLNGLPDEIHIAIQYTSVGAGSGESSIARIDNLQIR